MKTIKLTKVQVRELDMAIAMHIGEINIEPINKSDKKSITILYTILNKLNQTDI